MTCSAGGSCLESLLSREATKMVRAFGDVTFLRGASGDVTA